MTTRLFNANCSCSANSELRWTVRRCRMPIVATSAKAWPSALVVVDHGAAGLEEIEPAYDVVAQPHRQGGDGREADPDCARGEQRPAAATPLRGRG